MTTFFFVLKIVHLLAAALYAGGSFVNGLQETRANRSGDLESIVASLRFAALNNRVFLVPATLVLPVTGVAMAWLQRLPLFSSWLLLPLLLFALLTGLLVVSIRLEDRLCTLAEEARNRGGALDARYWGLCRLGIALGSTASLLIVGVFALMVLRRSLL